MGVEKVLKSKWVDIKTKLKWVEKRGNASYDRVETATKPIETRHVLGWKS